MYGELPSYLRFTGGFEDPWKSRANTITPTFR